MKKIKMFDFHEFGESASKKAEKYCWRGYRVLTFCPVCEKPLLSMEDAHDLKEAFASPQNYKRLETFTTTHDIGLLILVPKNLETAQLCGFRLVLAPICKNHQQINGEEIERRILLDSRF